MARCKLTVPTRLTFLQTLHVGRVTGCGRRLLSADWFSGDSVLSLASSSVGNLATFNGCFWNLSKGQLSYGADSRYFSHFALTWAVSKVGSFHVKGCCEDYFHRPSPRFRKWGYDTSSASRIESRLLILCWTSMVVSLFASVIKHTAFR